MMSSEEQEAFLTDHIPYRLGAIDLCEAVAILIRHGLPRQPTTIYLGEVATIRFPAPSIFTNAAVEHGFMSCRAMLECLGIGLDHGQTALAQKRPKRDDTVTLCDFGLELLTVTQLNNALRNDGELLEGLVRTIQAAHKGGAHLTKGGERLGAGPLSAGCRATRALVDRFLYGALNRAAPPKLIQVQNARAT